MQHWHAVFFLVLGGMHDGDETEGLCPPGTEGGKSKPKKPKLASQHKNAVQMINEYYHGTSFQFEEAVTSNMTGLFVALVFTDGHSVAGAMMAVYNRKTVLLRTFSERIVMNSGTSESGQLRNQANLLIWTKSCSPKYFTAYLRVCVSFVQESGNLANQECDQASQSHRHVPPTVDKIAIDFFCLLLAAL